MVDRPQVARQLGLFLDTLHTYPLDRAEQAGVREEIDMVAHWRNRAFEGLKRIVDFEANTHRLYQYLASNSPSRYEGAPRLVHNDLWAEHILINPHSGSVNGIIDWGDLSSGQPEFDFAVMYITHHNNEKFKKLVEGYGEVDFNAIKFYAGIRLICKIIRNIENNGTKNKLKRLTTLLNNIVEIN